MKPIRGSLDVLNLRQVYPSTMRFNLPTFDAYRGELPDSFQAWTNRKRVKPDEGLHFFIDDHFFESVWRNPGKYRKHVDGRVVASPDFSLYPEMPEAMLIWNLYRARWTARALHDLGALVIPSVSWTSRFQSFSALPHNGLVAISAYGAKRSGEAFRRGYERMIGTVQPLRVLVIGGTMPDWLKSDSRVTYRAANTIADRR